MGFFDNKRKEAAQYMESWQSTMYSVVVFGATMVVIFWASVFFYTSFYFTFMPQESITWPINFQFSSCEGRPGICSNPKAVIPVLDPTLGSLLARGQKYRVVVDLEMPESPMNQRIGMFLVNMEMKNQAGETLRWASRSTMLRYKSQLLHTISTVVFAPFLLYGIQEEKQMVTVELFSQYEEDPVVPLSDVHVELASRHIDLYSAQLRIHAMFAGLRYFMYYYPLSAAVVGVGICMMFLSTVVILSWYQFSGSTLSPIQPGAFMTFPNGSATSIQRASNPGVSNKSVKGADDTTAVVPGESNAVLNKTRAGKEGTGEPTAKDEEAAARASPVPGKGDGDDFEVVSSSKSQAGAEEDCHPASYTRKNSEGETIVRHRVQSIK